MNTKCQTPKTQKKFGTIWGELDYVCQKIHYWLYKRKDKTAARRFRGRLKRILQQLPENKLAIVREEGLALLHELDDENAIALEHRKREIHLLEKLHSSVRQSVRAGDYDEGMGASILAGRDNDFLQERRAIADSLRNCE